MRILLAQTLATVALRGTLILSLVLSLLLSGSVQAAAQTPNASVDPERVADLREAHLSVAAELDGIALISAITSGITTVFEGYCAINLLIPNADGFSGLDFGLGLGCLAATVTLAVITANRLEAIRNPEEHLEAAESLSGDEVTEEEFRRAEEVLEDAAAASERRLWINVVLGSLELIATGVLIGLVAEEEIDPAAGTSIAMGTLVVGLLNLSSLFLTPVAAAGLEDYRAGRGRTNRLQINAAIAPVEEGVQLSAQLQW